jgi:chemotaxis protein methyltransferase CheR
MATASAPIRVTDAELKLLQTLVYQECGMCFDERRVHFLADRLQRRLRACQIASFYDYYRLLTSAGGRRELSTLLENLAIHETSFFRNKPQLELFHKTILSELLERKGAANDFHIRVWSAGCSTGQEPYTLAMLVVDALAYHCLRQQQPLLPAGQKPLVPAPWKVEFVASDLSYPALRAGQEASYPESQLEEVDYTYRLRFFDRVGNRYVIKKSLRELVQFDFHNLKSNFLPKKNDVIFCRNVMIYFDEAEQKRLVEKFYRCLNPHGYLFIGHAESLFSISDRFQMIHEKSGTAYQRLEETA